MKTLLPILLTASLLFGCAYNQYEKDTVNNQFFERTTHADPSADYVGEWTAPTKIGFRSLKILEDGRILVCLSPRSGLMQGKVYLENESPAFMIKNGAKAKIISIAENLMILEMYGKQEQYYKDTVPDECVLHFKEFK
jgi:hypothetical protein